MGVGAVQNGAQLPLERCPHCGVAKPHLACLWNGTTTTHAGQRKRHWWAYSCASCGGCVLSVNPAIQGAQVSGVWPETLSVSEAVPERARAFLLQAINSLQAPAGAVMLAASSVDAMLKDKGFTEGTLNSRIDAAASAHQITPEMAAWAHDVRLDANDQRHADEGAALPDETDAAKSVEFASALAQFLYVLPARVERGRSS